MKIVTNINNFKKFNNKKIIGMCHGVFDIIHSGHIEYFKEAKKMCDTLIVSVTNDNFVNKSKYQPYNKIKKRLNVLSSISFIDYLIVSDAETAIKNICKIQPDLYIKGKDYVNETNNINLLKETKAVEKFKGKLVFTKSSLMSSSKILNNKLMNWNKNQKNILKIISKNNLYSELLESLLKISKKEFNVIGETIVDEYIFVDSIGITSKDPALSFLQNKTKKIVGGVTAVAKILSEFSKKVNLFTYGNKNYLKSELKKYKNIEIINLDPKKKIQKKSRIINRNRSEKIIQITNFEKNKTHENDTEKYIKKLSNKNLSNLIICDYGIDLLDKRLIKFLEKRAPDLNLNVQTNSLNLGYNLFTKYQKYKYLSLDKREWSLGLGKINLTKKDVSFFASKNSQRFFSFTNGKQGSVLFHKKRNYESNVLAENLLDTTGCGDAFFVISSILINSKMNLNFIPILSNIYAGLHGNFLGNEKIVSKEEYLKLIKTLSRI